LIDQVSPLNASPREIGTTVKGRETLERKEPHDLWPTVAAAPCKHQGSAARDNNLDARFESGQQLLLQESGEVLEFLERVEHDQRRRLIQACDETVEIPGLTPVKGLDQFLLARANKMAVCDRNIPAHCSCFTRECLNQRRLAHTGGSADVQQFGGWEILEKPASEKGELALTVD
jgi:hypothetical protein